jgi:phosphomevalonate kinase
MWPDAHERYNIRNVYKFDDISSNSHYNSLNERKKTFIIELFIQHLKDYNINLNIFLYRYKI